MRVIVGSAGSSTGYGIVKSLRAAFGENIFIVAADTNAPHLVAASMISDVFVSVSKASDDSFKGQLRKIVNEHNIKIIFPVHNTEVSVVAEMRQELKGVYVVASSRDVIDISNDKILGFEVLGKKGLPVPATCKAEEVSNVPEQGLFLKPRFGVGSVGVTLCRSMHDIRDLLDKSTDDYIAQTVCYPPEITVDFFSDGNGYVYSVCRERLEVKAGVCVKARIFQSPEVERLISEFVALTGYTGVACVQLMKDHSGNYVFTDINPRTGGGTAMSLPVGVNFPAAELARVVGMPYQEYLPAIKKEHYVVRQYEEFLTR